MLNDESRNRLVVKPVLLSRIIMWCVGVGGLLLFLVAWGVAEEEGLAPGVFVAAGGMFFIVFAASGTLSRVIVTPAGVTYWNLHRRRVPSSRISGIRVGEGSGAYYPRLAIWIERTDAKPVRLTALQQPESRRGQRALEDVAESIAAIVGHPAVRSDQAENE